MLDDLVELMVRNRHCPEHYIRALRELDEELSNFDRKEIEDSENMAWEGHSGGEEAKLQALVLWKKLEIRAQDHIAALTQFRRV